MNQLTKKFSVDSHLETEAVIFSSCFAKYFKENEPIIFGTK